MRGTGVRLATEGNMNQKFLPGLMTAALLLGLAACGGGGETPAPAPTPAPVPVPAPAPPPPPPPGTVIGAAGGTVTGPSGVSVVIPAGALTTETRINIAAGSTPLPTGLTAAGQIFSFT